MRVETTTNYNQFKFLLANRAIRECKVKKLVSEIGMNGLKVPIIVNENLEVIDGQHRLTACKQIHEPIKYLVAPGATVEDAAAANQAGSNWSTRDWIDYHAELGNKHYKKLQKWISVCKSEGVNSLDLAQFFAQNTTTQKNYYLMPDGTVTTIKKQGSIGIGTDLKNGYWEFGDEDKAYEMLGLYQEFSKTAPWAEKKSFAAVLMRVNRIKDFDAKWLLSQIEKYPQMWYNCINRDAFITMIEDIYNFRKARKNRLPIKNNPQLAEK